MRELYHERDLTQEEVAEELGCGETTVNNWVHRHDLEVNDIGSTNHRIREVDLFHLYWGEGYSQSDIAEICDCSVALVSKQMKKRGIPTRRSAGGMPQLYTRKQAGHEYLTTGGCGDDVPLHRLLAVAVFGFDAVSDTVVHHKNKIPWDNRPTNLECMSNGEHTSHHNSERDYSAVKRDEKGRIVEYR
jgi:predicted transcriptional regulator